MQLLIFKSLAATLAGLALWVYGGKVLARGEMRVRRARAQDSQALRRRGVFTGAEARVRGLLLTAVGVSCSFAGVAGLVQAW